MSETAAPVVGAADVPSRPGLSDAQLLRYARHVLLDGIGIEGQERLLSSHALLIGAGGLGSAAGLYLGSAGVARLTIVDDDVVEWTNLQRQIAHGTASLGSAKVDSLARAIAALNPEVATVPVRERATAQRLDAWVAAADVVLDCSDNFATRHAVNAACVRHATPLVAGAAIAFDGQLTVVDTRRDDAPCYACIYPPAAGTTAEADCATMGVFAPLVGVIGSLQACEALKLLAGSGASLAGRLLLFDARTSDWTELRVGRDPHCPVCAERAPHAVPPNRSAVLALEHVPARLS